MQQSEQHDERNRDDGHDANLGHPDRGDTGRYADERQGDLAAYQAEESAFRARCFGVGDAERGGQIGELEPCGVHLCFAHRAIPAFDAVGVL